MNASFGWWVGAVHALLALSWTAYVLFLPTFVARVGLPASLVVWIVLLDQALFTVTDWAAAVLADRVAQVWRRLGAAIAAAALVCGLLFAVMPWAADSGSSGWLLAVIACWVAISSFVRAPVLALLGHIGNATRQGWAVALALGLVGVAGGLAPLLAGWLRAQGPHWPFALAAGALALAGLVALQADTLPAAARGAAAGTRAAPLAWMIALLWLAALGFQWHTNLLAKVSPLPWVRTAWTPLFWAGFTLGLLLSSLRLAAMPMRLRAAAMALMIGAGASQVALHAMQQAAFVPAQLLVGAAWAVALHTGLSLALARSPSHRLATPVGLVFSALALAALCRVAVVAVQWQGAPLWSVLPSVAWLVAALGFWWHPWRQGAAA